MRTYSSGSNMQEVLMDTTGGNSVANWIGAFVGDITFDSLSIQTGGAALTKTIAGLRANGFLRLIVVALP